MTKYFNN